MEDHRTENNGTGPGLKAKGNKGYLEKITDWMAGLEKGLLVLCLGFMVVLVLVQIGMRNIYDSGVAGGDSMVKHMVLWVGFIGAGLATREQSHIRIDIASKLLPRRMKPFVTVILDIFSIIVSIMLVYAAYEFVAIEREGRATIPFLDIPVWVMQIVIPIGFVVITLRFAFQALLNLKKIVKGQGT
ncbi:MAG: TRAP transporter small permease [Thermodesulfobacteriota bacterium]